MTEPLNALRQSGGHEFRRRDEPTAPSSRSASRHAMPGLRLFGFAVTIA
jgi:hypothetical protein